MPFDNPRFTEEHNGVGSGILLDEGKAQVKSFDDYLANTPTGRILQAKSGVVQALDATANPVIVGASLRNTDGTIEQDVYGGSVLGETLDNRTLDVGVFHAVSVDLFAGANPSSGNPVYYINVAGATAGQVTQDSTAAGAVLLPNTSFYQDAGQNAWFVMFETILNNA